MGALHLQDSTCSGLRQGHLDVLPVSFESFDLNVLDGSVLQFDAEMVGGEPDHLLHEGLFFEGFDHSEEFCGSSFHSKTI